MLLLDVNVLVHAHRSDMPNHKPMRSWLTGLVLGNRAFGIPSVVFSGFIRVVTRKPFDPPATLAEALEFCREIMTSPRCLLVQPGEAHWGIFDELCRRTDARGNLISDAYLAAMAIERDCTFVTGDRDFSRFPGLRWRRPLDSQVTTNPR